MSDLISRQTAIEAICKACGMEEDYHKCDGYPEESTWCDKLVALRAVPSALLPRGRMTRADKIRTVDYDEGIRIGVELAAMHGADATSKQLEDAFWCGFEEAMKKRDVVVQKHGKWILKQEYDICEEDGEKYWECSLCGCGSDSYDTTFHTKFCPNCGAKMEAEDGE